MGSLLCLLRSTYTSHTSFPRLDAAAPPINRKRACAHEGIRKNFPSPFLPFLGGSSSLCSFFSGSKSIRAQFTESSHFYRALPSLHPKVYISGFASEAPSSFSISIAAYKNPSHSKLQKRDLFPLSLSRRDFWAAENGYAARALRRPLINRF